MLAVILIGNNPQRSPLAGGGAAVAAARLFCCFDVDLMCENSLRYHPRPPSRGWRFRLEPIQSLAELTGIESASFGVTSQSFSIKLQIPDKLQYNSLLDWHHGLYFYQFRVLCSRRGSKVISFGPGSNIQCNSMGDNYGYSWNRTNREICSQSLANFYLTISVIYP